LVRTGGVVVVVVVNVINKWRKWVFRRVEEEDEEKQEINAHRKHSNTHLTTLPVARSAWFFHLSINKHK